MSFSLSGVTVDGKYIPTIRYGFGGDDGCLYNIKAEVGTDGRITASDFDGGRFYLRIQSNNVKEVQMSIDNVNHAVTIQGTGFLNLLSLIETLQFAVPELQRGLATQDGTGT